MKVIEQFNKTDKPLISFEILPPLKGKSIQSMYRILDLLMEFNPPFINVTYHRAEYKFKLLPSGLYEKVYTRKRPGTVGICAAIQYKYGVDAVPHLVCGGFNRNETEDALVDLNYLGVNNVLLLRGDAVKGERSFQPEVNGHKNALELVEQVVNMNHGNYLEEDLRNPVETEFCIGVAGYPEKHQEAPNTTSDLKYLKKKIDAGADYIVTQMFFDNQKYFDFVKDCRAAGINVPIIPGIKPITTQSQIRRLPGIFNISLPEDLVTEIQKSESKERVKEVGIEWTVQQCRELLEFGVPCLHFYTMSAAGPFQKIMKSLF